MRTNEQLWVFNMLVSGHTVATVPTAEVRVSQMWRYLLSSTVTVQHKSESILLALLVQEEDCSLVIRQCA